MTVMTLLNGIDVDQLNGIDVDQLRSLREAVEIDRSEADRAPVVVAHWEGGSRSRVEFKNKVTYIGGVGELNPMQTLLAALVACEVDLIATHAAFLDIPIESLTVEATGHFNIAAYLALMTAPDRALTASATGYAFGHQESPRNSWLTFVGYVRCPLRWGMP